MKNSAATAGSIASLSGSTYKRSWDTRDGPIGRTICLQCATVKYDRNAQPELFPNGLSYSIGNSSIAPFVQYLIPNTTIVGIKRNNTYFRICHSFRTVTIIDVFVIGVDSRWRRWSFSTCLWKRGSCSTLTKTTWLYLSPCRYRIVCSFI